MKFKFETKLDWFLFFVMCVKIVFVLSALGHVILSHASGSEAKKIDPKMVYWKQRTEFVFTVSMAILLVYHFNPRWGVKTIQEETSILFFLFGCVLLLTAKWGLFIKEAPWFREWVRLS